MSRSRKSRRHGYWDAWNLMGLLVKVQRKYDAMNHEARDLGFSTPPKDRNYAASRARNCGSNYF